MEHVHYNFYKDGVKYSAMGDNPASAQLKLEIQSGVDLKGAKYETVYKMRVVETGTAR